MAAVIIAVSATAAHADNCQLTRVASLDMTMTDDGRILVPVKFGDTSTFMMIDTGAPLSALEPDSISDLGLTTKRIYQGQMFNSLGQAFTDMAVVPSLTLDNFHGSDVKFLVDPSRLVHDARVAGTLGADFLRHYDVELDFANRKLNLFTQDHCPGKVIYWPASAVAVVPFQLAQTGHIVLSLQLDGQPIQALFDTGAGYSVLDLATAQDQFGLKSGAADMTPNGYYGENKSVPVYLHTFKTLDFDGLAIGNPRIYIFEQEGITAAKSEPEIGTRLSSGNANNGWTPMILGIKEVSHLHLFISYAEQKLYVTPAGADAAASVATSAAH
jgi:predicted aspartyl protease